MFKRMFVLLVLVGCAGERGVTPPPAVEVTVRIDPPPSVVVAVSETVAPIEETTTTTTIAPVVDYAAVIESERAEHGRCGEWHDLAISVGWQEEEWATLSTVLWTESRCTPDAWNGHDAGLTQINQIHSKWLAELGLDHPTDMFDPRLNLWFAYQLYSSREEIGKCGWKPWTEPCN